MADATASPWQLPIGDLDASLEASESDLSSWKGARVLLTGGTGFLGSWLLSTMLRAGARLDLGWDILVVTRNPAAVPIDEDDHLHFIQADVKTLPSLGELDLIIHGAASSSATFGVGDGEPREMAATIVDGSRSVLEAGAAHHARVLFLSSGAVYGPQFSPVDETTLTAPNPLDPHSAYGLAKRLAESMFVAATAAGDVDAVIARLFAFVGPRLPLDAHYAAGNFVNDVLHHRTIRIRGDGQPRRSYLYSGDISEWCWAILTRGRAATAYNVGSPDPVTIEELAQRAARLSPTPLDVKIEGSRGIGPDPWYVPSTELAASELGLRPRTGLDEALAKYLTWERAH